MNGWLGTKHGAAGDGTKRAGAIRFDDWMDGAKGRAASVVI